MIYLHNRVPCSCKIRKISRPIWNDFQNILSKYSLKRSEKCRCKKNVCVSCVWLFATPWTVAHQAPLFMEFSRQEYWSGLPWPPPGDLPNPILNLGLCIAGRYFTIWATREYQCLMLFWGLPWYPVAKTASSQCRGPGFGPWSGN